MLVYKSAMGRALRSILLSGNVCILVLSLWLPFLSYGQEDPLCREIKQKVPDLDTPLLINPAEVSLDEVCRTIEEKLTKISDYQATIMGNVLNDKDIGSGDARTRLLGTEYAKRPNKSRPQLLSYQPSINELMGTIDIREGVTLWHAVVPEYGKEPPIWRKSRLDEDIPGQFLRATLSKEAFISPTKMKELFDFTLLGKSVVSNEPVYVLKCVLSKKFQEAFLKKLEQEKDTEKKSMLDKEKAIKEVQQFSFRLYYSIGDGLLRRQEAYTSDQNRPDSIIEYRDVQKNQQLSDELFQPPAGAIVK